MLRPLALRPQVSLGLPFRSEFLALLKIPYFDDRAIIHVTSLCLDLWLCVPGFPSGLPFRLEAIRFLSFHLYITTYFFQLQAFFVIFFTLFFARQKTRSLLHLFYRDIERNV